MECIRKYDIELEKEVYYGGETLKGCVIIENVENLRVNSRNNVHLTFIFALSRTRVFQFFLNISVTCWNCPVRFGVFQESSKLDEMTFIFLK